MISELYIILITLAAAVIAAFAQYMLKLSVERFDIGIKGIKSLIQSRGIWAGIAIYAISLAVYLSALKYGDLSFVYPTFASTFIFITLISHFVLKEKIDPRRIVGIFLVIMGIIVVAMTY